MKKSFVVQVVAAVLALPAMVLAGNLSAGFPAQPIWISKTTVSVGESLDIFTVVFNSTADSIQGDVIFTVDDARVGSKHFSLAPGKTETESVPWVAKAGQHSFGASIETNGQTINAESINTKAGSVEISIAEPEAQPTIVAQTVQTITTVALQVASTTTPILKSVAQEGYNATENFRNAGIAYVQNAVSSEPASATREETSSSETAVPGKTQSYFSKFAQLAAPAILFTFNSRAVFYPLLCALLLGGLYLLTRMVRRRQY